MNFKNRQQMLVILAAAVAGLLVLDKLLISPYVNAWKTRNERIVSLQESLQHGRDLLSRTNSLEAQWQEFQKKSLPADESVAENEVLNAVVRWARNSRVDFNSLIPQWRDHDNGYRTLEFRANSLANLMTATRFLYELETDPTGVRVEECELTANDERGERVNMRIRFSALQLPKDGAKKTTRAGSRSPVRTETKKK